MACEVKGCAASDGATTRSAVTSKAQIRRTRVLGPVAEWVEMVIMASVWGTRDVIVRVRVYTERPSG
jgi:hypothetical protein